MNKIAMRSALAEATWRDAFRRVRNHIAFVAAGIFAAAAPLSSQADTGPLNGTPDDVRVAPLVTAHWSQGDAGGQRCYNYYTPLNRACGCTATALGQIMYYHKYPTTRILPGETLYDSIDGYGSYSVSTNGTGGMTNTTTGEYTAFDPPYGGPYDWSIMVDSPTSSTSENARKAIGQLTRDAGFAVFSHYFSGGSTSGYSDAIASSIILNLHYADAVLTRGFNADKLIANLDAGLPVEVGLQQGSSGHAVVADGYGYHNGKLYIHINYGYSGSKDGWYDTTADINGMSISDMVANIFPPTRGARYSSVISGRVLDASGNPVANATVTATGATTATTTSSEKGIYAFVLPAGRYDFTATSGSSSGTLANCGVEASSQKTRAEGSGWETGVNNSRSGVNVTLGKTATMNEPDAYLDYVESDGHQAVDTGVTPGPTESVTPAITSMKVDADLEWISGGYMLSSNWHDFHPLKNNEDKIGASFKNSSDAVMNLASGKSLNSGRHRVVTTVVKDQPFSVDVDGVKSTSSGNVAAKGSGRTLYAFASNNGSTAGDGNSTAKLYGMKIYINDELVRDLVPGIKNGVAGLYDRQNDKWYASQSGTALIAGPVYVPSTAKQAKLKVSGYRKMGTIENFQALVKLSDGDDYGFSYADCAASDGSDLWFTDAEGTLIPHDIDTWNTNGASFVWVKIPSLAYNTTITMHWGEARTQEQTCNPSDTWEGFVGVWHMNKTGTTAEPDSTGHGLNAAPINNSSASTSINTDTNGGQVGNGRAVSQATMFKVSGHASYISEAKTFTIGGWVKRTGSGDYPRIFVGNPNNSTRTKWEVYGWSATELIARGGGDTDFKRSVDLSTSAGWKYLTVVYTGTTATIYDNGAPVGNAGAINNAVQDSYFTIGAVSGADNRSFVGTFDEVRMYNGSLSADRIAADYATMHAPTEFITPDVPPQNEPDAYLDYVESDGRQWVNLSSLKQTATMTFDADMEWKSDANGAVFIGQSWHARNMFMVKDSTIRCMWFMGDNYAPADTGVRPGDGQRHRFVVKAQQGQKLSVTVDGGTPVYSANNSDRSISNPDNQSLYLFAQHQGGGTAVADYSSVKLYGLKVCGADGELALDLVPGIKNSVAGLYDRLNDVWYVSQSGVPLNPGPVTEPHNAPDVYLDYVKSTGAQWVSVGITPTQTMKFDVDVDWISGNALMAQSNYGLSPLTVNNGTIVSRWWMADSAASANTGVGLDTGRRRFVITTSNAAYVSTSVDGGTPALSGGYSNRSGVNPSDLYIFAVHYGGTVGNAGEYSTAKLYGLKIYSNGVLMRDYVPGIKDNVAGLYDRVNDNFVSSGSGTPLEAGPVVDRSKPDSFVEYVESNGSQWVDTGVDGRAGVKAEADIDWISGNAPLAVYGNGHCFLLQALGTIGGQALGSGEVKTGIALDSGRHLIVSEVPAGSKMTITVDGTTTAQSAGNVSASGNTGMTIWMFAAHHYSGSQWGEGASKFYELKLWRTGSDNVRRIQRHFIPCLKGGRAGLYDAVSGVIFYSHSGTDLVASSTPRTLSVWRNEADDASLDNAANWCGNLPNGTDAVVCAPWVPAVSATDGLAFANLTVFGGDLAFADGTNTVAGALASDGALAFTNLVINGSADCAVAISGFISGHGTVKSLTLAEGARFIPDGVGYLTVSDALDGTMLIDMTGIDLSGVTGRFPLFKTGMAEILPTADAVEFVGGSAPSGRLLLKVSSGFGYDLGSAGFFILLR